MCQELAQQEEASRSEGKTQDTRATKGTQESAWQTDGHNQGHQLAVQRTVFRPMSLHPLLHWTIRLRGAHVGQSPCDSASYVSCRDGKPFSTRTLGAATAVKMRVDSALKAPLARKDDEDLHSVVLTPPKTPGDPPRYATDRS